MLIKSFLYHDDLEKQGECGVVAHERQESHVSHLSKMLSKENTFSNLPASLYLNGNYLFKNSCFSFSFQDLLVGLCEAQLVSYVIKIKLRS